MLKNGRTWSRSLYGISKCYIPLYEKLREEQIIPDDLHEVLSTLPSNKAHHRTGQFMYTLNDEFIVDFSKNGLFFFVITEQGAETLPFHKIFFDNRRKYECTPYTGAYTNHHLSILLN